MRFLQAIDFCVQNSAPSSILFLSMESVVELIDEFGNDDMKRTDGVC
jgi:hypothetical protein